MSFDNELKGLVRYKLLVSLVELTRKIYSIHSVTFQMETFSIQFLKNVLSHLIPRLSLSQFLHTHGQIPLSVKVNI